MNTSKILRLQEMSRRCLTVYAIEITCEGEVSIDAVWENEEAAELHRRSMRNRGYKVRIVPMKVRTLEMAKEYHCVE
jgi:hypothetical protein